MATGYHSAGGATVFRILLNIKLTVPLEENTHEEYQKSYKYSLQISWTVLNIRAIKLCEFACEKHFELTFCSILFTHSVCLGPNEILSTVYLIAVTTLTDVDPYVTASKEHLTEMGLFIDG